MWQLQYSNKPANRNAAGYIYIQCDVEDDVSKSLTSQHSNSVHYLNNNIQLARTIWIIRFNNKIQLVHAKVILVPRLFSAFFSLSRKKAALWPPAGNGSHLLRHGHLRSHRERHQEHPRNTDISHRRNNGPLYRFLHPQRRRDSLPNCQILSLAFHVQQN